MRRTSVALGQTAYDYVIVGGGSAGCVLANRLSADPSVSVALLEAGPEDTSVAIQMPLGLGLILPTWGGNGRFRLTKDKLNWGFEGEEEENVGRRLYQPRGRCMGGSSSINAMLYVRGHKEDYNDWAKMLDDPAWGWDSALKSFKAMENFVTPNTTAPYMAQHGTEGELTVEHYPTVNPYKELDDMFLKASKDALGVEYVEDYNTGETAGSFYYQKTTFEGRRFSAHRAFVAPLRSGPMRRDNLTVLPNTQVAKVNLDGKEATGVDWFSVKPNGKRASGSGTLTAKRRVILAAGALQSPQILQLSGIGARDDLEPHTIEVQHHLPGVGAHLIDHADVGVSSDIDTTKGVLDATSTPGRLPDAYFQYLRWKKGDWRSSFWSKSATESGYFYSTSGNPMRPDIQGHFVPAKFRNHAREPSPCPGYAMKSCLLYPKSEGFAKLYSKDPMDAPRLRMNFMKEEEDMEKMKKAVRAAACMLMSKTFDKIRKGEGNLPELLTNDKALEEYILSNVETLYHPVGTCKMGADDMSVVDTNCSVHGLSGLSVVDASIYPTLVGGNTNAPTMMMADIAAGKIKALDA